MFKAMYPCGSDNHDMFLSHSSCGRLETASESLYCTALHSQDDSDRLSEEEDISTDRKAHYISRKIVDNSELIDGHTVDKFITLLK